MSHHRSAVRAAARQAIIHAYPIHPAEASPNLP
jgi:hypothetical protein